MKNILDKDYQPRDTKEAQYGYDQMAKGFSEGYHRGLEEGYNRAGKPELCHCHCCRSHGEYCRLY